MKAIIKETGISVTVTSVTSNGWYKLDGYTESFRSSQLDLEEKEKKEDTHENKKEEKEENKKEENKKEENKINMETKTRIRKPRKYVKETELKVLLAKKFEDKVPDDLTKFGSSEKLDGMRAYYDDKEGGLYRRNGHKIHAQDWFLDEIPKGNDLDGELWISREKKAFDKFDFIPWLESKIEGKSFAEILRNNFIALKKIKIG